MTLGRRQRKSFAGRSVIAGISRSSSCSPGSQWKGRNSGKPSTLSGAHGNELFQFAVRAAGEKAYAVAARAYQEAIGAPLSADRMPYARYGYAAAVGELQADADTFASPVRGTPATEAVPLYGGAVRLFQKIIEDYPHTQFSAKSWYQIGLLQSEKFGDREGAVISLRHVIEEAGPLPSLRNDATLMMGKVHIARGDTAKAAECFRTVVAAPDALPDAHDEAVFRLGEIDYFAGRFDSAMQKLGGITVNLKADYANDALRLGAFLQENAGTVPEALRQFSAGKEHGSRSRSPFGHPVISTGAARRRRSHGGGSPAGLRRAFPRGRCVL